MEGLQLRSNNLNNKEMNRQQIDDAQTFLLIEAKKAELSKEDLSVKVTPGLYAAIVNLLLFVLQFAKQHTLNEDGSPKKIRWYDFLFNKALREFAGRVIGFVLDLFKTQ